MVCVDVCHVSSVYGGARSGLRSLPVGKRRAHAARCQSRVVNGRRPLALELALGRARAFDVPTTTSQFFIDVWGLVHEQEINDIAAAGISGGCGARRYCPRSSVTREQMAAFLRRAIVEHARISAPPALAMCSWTLQAAVDATPSGSRMVVPACTYRETVTIRKPLTLVTDGGADRRTGSAKARLRRQWK